ncbi:uncharacterized protein LOC131670047 [Phymastichus coffea]|uniref:uncharacterized protein LOC131670047 n=1 Tax=Phymastichus coffea TaxID=108790 RepID=UPI00273B7A06|nr:uncharacterized protein LOC131670047 [Phymastichus coffea]
MLLIDRKYHNKYREFGVSKTNPFRFQQLDLCIVKRGIRISDCTMAHSIEKLQSFNKPKQTDEAISELPTELFQTIFDYLDGRTLLNAALVSHRWLGICKLRTFLRKKIRTSIAVKNLCLIIGAMPNEVEQFINQ